MLALHCATINYDWGKPAEHSEVAKLAKGNGSGVDPSKPYAELWMGTHENGPSRVAATDRPLSEWIAENPSCLGTAAQQRFGTTLPFLFKVLSVNKVLPLQSHPSKQLAERIHKEQPQLFTDPNHKPEMALALTDDFHALSCFAPLPTIVSNLAATPELAELLGPAHTSALTEAAAEERAGRPTGERAKEALRSAFTALIMAPEIKVEEAVTAWVTRIKEQEVQKEEVLQVEADGVMNADQSNNSMGLPNGQKGLQALHHLVLQLSKQYPGDVGILAAAFLNLIHLRAGEALYLPADEPHAYLGGELIECMATSDNVLEAGFTPQSKGSDVFCSSLTYDARVPEVQHGTCLTASLDGANNQVSGSLRGNGSITVYRPPFDELEVMRVQVGGKAGAAGTDRASSSSASLALPTSAGPQVLLVQQGSGRAEAQPGSVSGAGLQQQMDIGRGKVLFIPAATSVTLHATEPMTCYVAAVNANFLSNHA